jgi:hypothetical protein
MKQFKGGCEHLAANRQSMWSGYAQGQDRQLYFL